MLLFAYGQFTLLQSAQIWLENWLCIKLGTGLMHNSASKEKKQTPEQTDIPQFLLVAYAIKLLLCEETKRPNQYTNKH